MVETHLEWAGLEATLVSDQRLADAARTGCANFQKGSGGPCRVEVAYGLPVRTREQTVRAELKQNGFQCSSDSWFQLDVEGSNARLVLPAWGSGNSPAIGVLSALRAYSSVELVRRGGLFLHASGAVIDGRALVFLGESGAGKTTMARLLPEVDVLNDELVAVLPKADHIEVHSTPFVGAYGLPRTRRRAPLGLACVLVKDTRTEMRAIARTRSFTTLMKCVALPASAEFESLAFEVAAKVHATAQFVELLFRRGEEGMKEKLAAAVRALATS